MSDYPKGSKMSQPTENGHLHVGTTEKRRTSVAGKPAHTEHGPLIDHKIPQADAVESEPDLLWSRIRRVMREPFSEFFGVFILILFGDGVVAQVVLSSGKKGDYQSISWGWG
jgi:aquaglyceroporin related protein, other eukaryote